LPYSKIRIKMPNLNSNINQDQELDSSSIRAFQCGLFKDKTKLCCWDVIELQPFQSILIFMHGELTLMFSKISLTLASTIAWQKTTTPSVSMSSIDGDLDGSKPKRKSQEKLIP